MANIWRDPIFDRTSQDVAFALQQIAAWKQSHTHAADVKVDSEKLSLNADGTVSVTNDSAVLDVGGNTRVENNVLVVEFGVVGDLKGCLNLSDITRIEDNITYLSDALTKHRYPIDSSSRKWMADSLPTDKDIKRIIANIRSIFSEFATPINSAALPETMLSYQDVNIIEQNLYLLKQLLDAMEASFIKSGAYKSGATNRLPIRR